MFCFEVVLKYPFPILPRSFSIVKPPAKEGEEEEEGGSGEEGKELDMVREEEEEVVEAAAAGQPQVVKYTDIRKVEKDMCYQHALNQYR